MTRPTVIVATRTGGQGKTLVAQLLAIALELADAPVKLAAADTVKKDGQTSKLGKLFPDVTELGTGADLGSGDAAAIRHWDEFGKTLLAGDYIVDAGANLIQDIFAWARVREAGRVLRRRGGLEPVLVVPVVAERQSVEDALDVLKESFALGDSLPFSSRVLIENERDGSFEKMKTETKYKELRALSGVATMTLPRCSSEVWADVVAQGIPLRTLIDMSEDEFEEKFFPNNPFEASGAQAALVGWAAAAMKAFDTVGLTTEAPAVA